MLNDRNFSYIKPLRQPQNEMPILSSKRCEANFYNGVETTIFLDLNIIDEMSKVIYKEKAFNDSYVSLIVKSLNELPHNYLSAGLAFSEVCETFKTSRYEGFELFLKKYLPQYADAHNSVDDVYKRTNSRIFRELSEHEKKLYSFSYVSLLKINHINRKFTNLSPLQKFYMYINYMNNEANIISALDAEIAKYYFADDFNIQKFYNEVQHREI